MSSQGPSKKVMYSNDYKVKVLEYFFKHGGEKKFGLKSKTALHFGMDKKTVSRMLRNPDMVSKAKKILKMKAPTATQKCSGTSSSKPKTPLVTRNVSVQMKPLTPGHQSLTIVTSGSCGADQSKMGAQASVIRVTNMSGGKLVKNSTGSKPSSSGSSQNKMASSRVAAASSSKILSTSTSGKSSSSSQSSKSSSSKKDTLNIQDKVPVIELPEDPDFSVLKKSILSSCSGVASVTKLLINGTQEVKDALLNECDLIYECKVCRNLFRSVVNFLAHKRIYCQDQYADVRDIYYPNSVYGTCAESTTVIKEEEPLSASVSSSSSEAEDVASKAIDVIARKLACKRIDRAETATSSSLDKGSSGYHRSVESTLDARLNNRKQCSVLLESIDSVPHAMYQTYQPAGLAAESSTTRDIVTELHDNRKEATAILNPSGEIKDIVSADSLEEEDDDSNSLPECRSSNKDGSYDCYACHTKYTTQKLFAEHMENAHNIRNVFVCPICNMELFSLSACDTHLLKVHSKKKHQRDRLRSVIKSRAYKKRLTETKSLMKRYRIEEKEDDEAEKKRRKKEEEEEEKKIKVEVLFDKSKCETTISSVTRPALPAMFGLVSSFTCRTPPLLSLSVSSQNNHPRSLPGVPWIKEEPGEKKIGIQIRKDYNKVTSPTPVVAAKCTHIDLVPKRPLQNVVVDAYGPDDRECSEAGTSLPRTVIEVLEKVSNLKMIKCNLCDKSFRWEFSLYRHMSQHLGWTRFRCKTCGFRSYYKRLCMQHCVSTHKLNVSIIDEHHFQNLPTTRIESQQLDPKEGFSQSVKDGSNPCIVAIKCEKESSSVETRQTEGSKGNAAFVSLPSNCGGDDPGTPTCTAKGSCLPQTVICMSSPLGLGNIMAMVKKLDCSKSKDSAESTHSEGGTDQKENEHSAQLKQVSSRVSLRLRNRRSQLTSDSICDSGPELHLPANVVSQFDGEAQPVPPFEQPSTAKVGECTPLKVQVNGCDSRDNKVTCSSSLPCTFKLKAVAVNGLAEDISGAQNETKTNKVQRKAGGLLDAEADPGSTCEEHVSQLS